jgi:hypothetical protein
MLLLQNSNFVRIHNPVRLLRIISPEAVVLVTFTAHNCDEVKGSRLTKTVLLAGPDTLELCGANKFTRHKVSSRGVNGGNGGREVPTAWEPSGALPNTSQSLKWDPRIRSCGGN